VLVSIVAWAVLTAASSPIRVAEPELRGANVPPQSLSFFSEHLAARLREGDVSPITSREIATLLSLERQKELLGCAEVTDSCIAELANALGVDGVLIGDVGHFGDVYQVELKVLAASGSGVLASWSTRVDSEKALLDALEVGAREISRALHARLGRAPPVSLSRTEGGSPTRPLAWALVVAGAVFAVTGGVLIGLANGDYSTLTAPPTGPQIDDATARGLASGGALKRNLGVASAIAGAAAIAAGVVTFVLTGRQSAPVALSISERGLAIVGAWP
jgi:hypothetical protein